MALPISLSEVLLSNWFCVHAFVFTHQSWKVELVPSHMPRSRRRECLVVGMVGMGATGVVAGGAGVDGVVGMGSVEGGGTAVGEGSTEAMSMANVSIL